MVTTRSRSLTVLVVVAAMLVPISVLSSQPANAVAGDPDLVVVNDDPPWALPPGAVGEPGDAEQLEETVDEMHDGPEVSAAVDAPATETSVPPFRPALSASAASSLLRNDGRIVFLDQPADITIEERDGVLLTVSFWVPTASALGTWERSVDQGLTWSALDSQRFGGGQNAYSHDYPMVNLWGAADGWLHRYTVTLTDGGSATSNTSVLSVVPGQIGISVNPSPQRVEEGQDAVFTATHGGSSSPAEVRWESSQDGSVWTEVEGTRAPSEFNVASQLTVRASLALDGTQYRAVFSNARTEATTRAASLSVVPTRPTIAEHPTSVHAFGGQSVTFTSAFTGTDAPTTAQWQVSTDGGETFPHVGGATEPTLTLEGVTPEMDGWQYRVRFTNAAGSAWSDPAVLTVSPVGFLEHPSDVTVNEGEVATHSVRIVPAEDAIFGWERSNDGGATWQHYPTVAPIEVRAGESYNQRLRVGVQDGVETGVTVASDGRLNRAYLQYTDHVVYSDTGLITVLPARVTVAEQPVGQSVLEGHEVTFSAAHGGTTFPVAAQWQFSTDGGATFSYVPGGATQQSLTLDSVTREMDGWQYRVRFTNAAGSAWSDAATLRVTFGIPAASGEAAPGEIVELRIYDPGATRAGVMTITAPSGTTIERVRHNSNIRPFEISEDGKTATSVRTAWGHAALSAWVTLRVADDAVPGSVLDDGTAHVVDAGVLTASGSLAVTVTGEIEIIEHPGDVTVDVGAAAELTAPVAGHGVTTQWQVSTDQGATWVDVDGGTGTTLTLEATTPEMTRSWYRAVHTNAAGQVVTDHAVLLVRTAPYFAVHPADAVVGERGYANFLGRVLDNTSDRTLAMSWEFSGDGESWAPYEHGTFPELAQFSNALALHPVAAEMDGFRFRAVAENHLGRAVSDPALLTVNAAPVIESHPADVRTLVDHDATFSASTPAVSPHRTQQWQERTEGGEWTDIPGATEPTYSTGPTVLEMDQQQYRVVFTNHHGSTASEPATLTVRAPIPATLSVTPTVRLVDQLP